MRIIEIAPLSNGAHRNQSGENLPVPEGWAVIPEDMDLPDSFPFVGVSEERGIVTALTAGAVPTKEPVPAPNPTPEEQLRADVDYIAAMTGVEL